MCGLAGFVDDAPADEKSSVLRSMTDVLRHRGPDDEGHFVDGQVAMGFRRLSIIDLQGGNQPICSRDSPMIITFNGEIYNYKELREELMKRGHIFTTVSDTEVILHGYEEWGEDVLNRLRGMFAFVIWDREKGRLFGARDHFGIKPLYYAQMGGTFMYASEIKSLLLHPRFRKELNEQALRPYLTFQYPALHETFFKGVFALPEGHCFTYEAGELKINRYYDCHFSEGRQSLEDLVDSIDSAVQDSVKAHQVADVEVGSFLSSGVDSSYVAALARPCHTYSIGFAEGGKDESEQADKLAALLDLDNTSEVLDGDRAFASFPQIQWYMDEPDSNPSYVPLFFLSELAARDLKVVLSGEGADELFAGYTDYGVHTRSKLIKVITRVLGDLPRSARYAIGRWARGRNFHGALQLSSNLGPAEENFIGQAMVFDPGEADRLLTPGFRSSPDVWQIVGATYDRLKGHDLSELKKKQYLDMHQWLPGDILLKADKMTMAHSLELRVPLLDQRLMTVAEQVPTRYLITDENTKYAFRLAAGRHLPPAWSKRAKMGFPVPIRQWLREEKYCRLVREVFQRDYTALFFNQEALLKMVDDNFSGKVDDRRKIWTVFTFLIWYDVYFIHDGAKPDLMDMAA